MTDLTVDADDLESRHPWMCSARTASGNSCSQLAAARHSGVCPYHAKKALGLFATEPGAHCGT
jgi:hypothetical protein